MAAGMTQEKRSAPRIAKQIRFAINDGTSIIQAETKNLSISGAYCLIDKFIAPMTKLEIRFELPHKPRPAKIRLTGVVVRVEPVVSANQMGKYNMAIFFSDLSGHDREAIAAFVREHLALTGKSP